MEKFEFTTLAHKVEDGYEEGRYNPIKQSIVRCKDCKFSEEMCDGRISCLGYLTEPWDYHNDKPNYTWVRPDGFCAWGVSRADA